MMVFKIVICHALLVGIVLSSPVENKVTEKKPISEATTRTPVKVIAGKNVNNEQVQNANNAQTEKSATKKKVGDYHYFDEEARRKRTTEIDNYREPEINLTPEDVMILAAYRQPHRLYNTFPYGRWSDINNSVDLLDTDVETDETYDRPENFFDRYYDQRYQNWDNLPRKNKFIMNRERRSYFGYPKLRVPIYKRAVL